IASDYAFRVPDTIPAGLTTFRLVNQGKELHHASLVRLRDGKSVADFQAALVAAMKNHTPPPAWMGFVCGIPSADGTPHVMKGMLHPVVVSVAPGATTAVPAADLSITLTDYDFQV